MLGTSGKFKSKKPVSTFVGDEKVNDNKSIAKQIPSLPVSQNANPIASFLTEYFGRFWWLWIVVLITLKAKKI